MIININNTESEKEDWEMNQISIVKAVHQSMVGAQLNVMALEYMAFPLARIWRRRTQSKGHFVSSGGRRTTVLVINTLMKLKWTGKL